MLKQKLKSLQKDINKLKPKINRVFFADLKDGEYTVHVAGKEAPVFQGNEDAFQNWKAKYPDSVFIINDIPDGREE